jgi:hypothetical protein
MKRPERFEFHLSASERAALARLAKARGISAADMARTLILEEDRRQKEREKPS